MLRKVSTRKTNPAPRYTLRGVSLVELMIGIAISLILMAGVITVFINLSASGTTVIKSTRLNNELRNTTNLIIRELQKAGYVSAWDAANEKIDTDALALFGNIGPQASCDISAAICDCFLYSYDFNEDSVLDDNEKFGFRLSNGRVQIKRSDTSANPLNNCTSGNWDSITSEDITITMLSFEIDGDDAQLYEIIDGGGTADSCVDTDDVCLDRRKINLVIAGNLASDDDVTMRMASEVKLMNDRYFTHP